VYLRDIWPTSREIQEVISSSISPEMFEDKYADVFTGNPTWNEIGAPESELYSWDLESTYIQEPPFFEDLTSELPPPADIHGARVLVLLGDSVTTDHISPAGTFAPNSPAGEYLMSRGVEPRYFKTYGNRRGNDRVMTRGTFANIRLKNLLVPGVEGGYTRHFPGGEQLSIFDAALQYKEEQVPLLVIAGSEYGTGSSRDWAAKGTLLLGVKAVIAESFERIHRSNLVGMGVLPLEFQAGENLETLGLDGSEVYHIEGLSGGLEPMARLSVKAYRANGERVNFKVTVRLHTPIEVDIYRNGGILHKVLRDMLTG
jgi:aconitate hydratase